MTLNAGPAVAVVDPAGGGRLAALSVAGVELLMPGAGFGSFPMAPWCGRLAGGVLRSAGRFHHFPREAPPHAIHGTVRNSPWRVVRAAADGALLEHGLGAPWPFAGRVTQEFALSPSCLRLEMTVESHGAPFPAQAGWHPWFRRDLGTGGPAELRLAAAWQEERGPDHLPTGRRIAPREGPWDDCFGMPDGVAVTVDWPGALTLEITSSARWVVIYDEPAEALCVEPQSGPPNGLNTLPRPVTPRSPLTVTSTWRWSPPAARADGVPGDRRGRAAAAR
ncbi:aldose 1-epimerase [Kitasatospora sp. NPDC056181]|uniref:aldose epimerase family protein n=1 Tax=Kitasatospora sp. NPDC056181 TaxID=3345737 RepID=UPI0035E14E4A